MSTIFNTRTFLVVWLICARVLEIESGLTKLLVSLGAAIAVYIIIGVKEYRDKKSKGADD